MAERDMVVIGASAGGIQALSDFVSVLPSALEAAVVVVLHRPAGGTGALPAVLGRISTLPVAHARHEDSAAPGRVYVAPPDHHILVRDGRILLARSPKVNRMRPAADTLFRSAARWYGPRAIGIVLSGALDDGAAGLAAISARGGAAMIQDPDEALFPGMPKAALAAVPRAMALPVKELAVAVAEMVGHEVPAAEEPDALLVMETDMAEREEAPAGLAVPGAPVPVACPECRGAMSRVDTAGAIYYRCHVGHSYSPQTLLTAQTEGTEAALWTAVSILEEQAGVHRTLAERASGEHKAAHREAAQRAMRSADAVRRQIHATPATEVAETTAE
jgi:two-component system, chemotaxis family, protein-glutamate methylesterase/glutaminase